jgi:hypothetical protein
MIIDNRYYHGAIFCQGLAYNFISDRLEKNQKSSQKCWVAHLIFEIASIYLKNLGNRRILKD